MIYDSIAAEAADIDASIGKLERQIAKFPAGRLICTRDDKYSKWYNSMEGKMVYICKKDRPFAERLARKKYLELQLEGLRQQKKAGMKYMENFSQKIAFAADELYASPPYNELLREQVHPVSQAVRDWQMAAYEKSESFPEKLTYRAVSGTMVRSKSEMIIDSELFHNGLPYRYECALYIGNSVFYPDFTILDPRTGRIYYWEHFGMMDKRSYAQNVFEKLKIYNDSNIILDHNLIATFETETKPFDFNYADKVIKDFFTN